MRIVRPSIPEDVPVQRELWRLAFGDGEDYIDNFYHTYYQPERVLVLEEEGVVRSMTAWFDTAFVVQGQGEYRAAYLYAVATHPDCRGRGVTRCTHGRCRSASRSRGSRCASARPCRTTWPRFYPHGQKTLPHPLDIRLTQGNNL